MQRNCPYVEWRLVQHVGATARTAFRNTGGGLLQRCHLATERFVPGAYQRSRHGTEMELPIPGDMGSGTLTLTAGWDGSGPTLNFSANSVKLTDAPFSVTTAFGYAAGSLTLDTEVRHLAASLGIAPSACLRLLARWQCSFAYATAAWRWYGKHGYRCSCYLLLPSIASARCCPGGSRETGPCRLVADLLINRYWYEVQPANLERRPDDRDYSQKCPDHPTLAQGQPLASTHSRCLCCQYRS